jgi:recombination protein RecT
MSENKATTGAATPAVKGQSPNREVQKKPGNTIAGMIEKLKPQIAAALPGAMTPDRMARIALTAIRNSPDLQRANPLSLMGAIITAAQLGLEPNSPLGQCYIIPYKGEASFQIGYKGTIELAHRSGMYKRIAAYSVDEADEFDYQLGLSPNLVHIPAKTPSGKSSYYYAVYELQNGGQDFRVWSREQVEAHRNQYSKSAKSASSPWNTNFDSMAKKTVLIDLLKYAPKSTEVAKATSLDNRTIVVDERAPDLQMDVLDGDFELEQE